MAEVNRDVVRVEPRRRIPTDDQLHGRSCIDCNSTQEPLLPAGIFFTRSGRGRLGWPVVACPAHTNPETAQ